MFIFGFRSVQFDVEMVYLFYSTQITCQKYVNVTIRSCPINKKICRKLSFNSPCVLDVSSSANKVNGVLCVLFRRDDVVTATCASCAARLLAAASVYRRHFPRRQFPPFRRRLLGACSNASASSNSFLVLSFLSATHAPGGDLSRSVSHRRQPTWRVVLPIFCVLPP